MNALVLKILAVGLTLSQLFTRPVDQFKTQFNVETDSPEVEAILRDGCHFITKEFGAEQIDFDFLFSMMIENLKAAQAKSAADGAAASTLAPSVDVHTFTSSRLTDLLDVPSIYSAYKEFCKADPTAKIALNEIITYYNQVMTDLPDAGTLKGLHLPESTLVLDRAGERFTEIYTDNNRRKWIAIDQIPEPVQKAFVAAEDKRFFEHHGLDVRGIVRAFATSVSSSKRPQGGSTITQQVVKNLLVGDDLTFERKMREMPVAARLEKILSKKEILELYLNFVFLGRASWGVEMAAQSYFGKSVRQLNASEGAILAALTRGPNFYDPDLHPDRLNERREYVLGRMKEDGYLNDEQFQAAVALKPQFALFESPRSRAAFYFLDEIQRDAHATAGIPSLTGASYVVRSTIHRELQRSVERALEDGLADYEAQVGRQGPFVVEGSLAQDLRKYNLSWEELLPKSHGQLWDIQWTLATYLGKTTRSGGTRVGLPDGRTARLVNQGRFVRSLKTYDLIRVRVNEGRELTASLRAPPVVQGAIVVLEAKTGRVLAMTGGFSYATSQLNRVTRTARQPGSTLKPFIYLTALNQGYQPNTLVLDGPLSLPPIGRGGEWWTPHNYDGGTRGLVTLRRAVEQSLNLPTARLMSELGQTPVDGLDSIRAVTKELGIYDDPIRLYPFVLGAQPTRLLDLAAAYATIANIGLKPTPHFVDSIEQNGKLIYQRPRFTLTTPASVDKISFYQIRRILEGTVARGTAVRLQDLQGVVAGKTGTSNNFNDAWFVGFTNDLVVATWVGYDDRKVAYSLGQRNSGAKVALPIGERVLRDSFAIYKDKEMLYGPPASIQAQIVDAPIDLITGGLNEGSFMETFRSQSPGVPKDTRMALLRGGEDMYGFAQNPTSDDEDQAMGMETQNFPPGYYGAGQPPDAYRPGAEDNFEMWQRRDRRVDGFFMNPFFRN